MARIDYAAIARRKAMDEAYAELQEFLKTKKGQKALPNWVHLQSYFLDQEKKIEDQEQKIKEYRNFFSTLSSLLPKKIGTNTLIG